MDDALLSRAFEVEEIAEDFDPSIPPSNGHEYLQHVMYEASKCPQVVVADIDRSKIKNHVNLGLDSDILLESDNQNSVSELAPSIEWQQEQVALFSDLRKKVEICRKSKKFKRAAVPKAHCEEKWYDMCIGDENSRIEPSLSILLSMNEPLLERVLDYHVEWLEEGLKPNQGKWIYALLACLELPLTSLSCSAVRDLARECAKLRSTKSSKDDPDVIALNLIICLVSKYFGQLDLAD